MTKAEKEAEKTEIERLKRGRVLMGPLAGGAIGAFTGWTVGGPIGGLIGAGVGGGSVFWFATRMQKYHTDQ